MSWATTRDWLRKRSLFSFGERHRKMLPQKGCSQAALLNFWEHSRFITMKSRQTFLILDNIRSRENVGSIFRTADGAGVSKIYLCGITPTPTRMTLVKQGSSLCSDRIHKTALGAETYVPWEYQSQTWKCLLKLKSNPPIGGEKSPHQSDPLATIKKRGGIGAGQVKIIGLEQTKGSINIFKFKPKFPLTLIVGNEVRGLSPKILKYCDKKISIPMYGKKESLNVSVAAGIAVYTIRRT